MDETDTFLQGELRKIQQGLKEVERFEFLSGPDSGGEPAVWVWAVLRVDTPEEETWSWENRQRIRSRIKDGLHGAGVSDWIYTRFRSADEETPSDYIHST